MKKLIDLPIVTQALDTARQVYARDNPASAAAFAQAKASGIAGGTNRASIFYPLFLLHLSMRTRRPRQPPTGST